VDIIAAWPLHQLAASRMVAFVAAVEADDVGAQLSTYGPLIETFVEQARPAWDLVSPQGPIPPTVAGCYHVPTPLLLQLIEAWLDTFAEPVKPARARRSPKP
jgi:hypothetical protein